MPKNCIKAIRQKKNMTREQLAALVDLQPEHIALFENGYMVPLRRAHQLAGALKEPLDAVFPSLARIKGPLEQHVEAAGDAGIDSDPMRNAFHFRLDNGLERTVWISGPARRRLESLLLDPEDRFVEFDTLVERMAVNTRYLGAWRFHDFDAEPVDQLSLFEDPSFKLWTIHSGEPIVMEIDLDNIKNDESGDEPHEDPMFALFGGFEVADGVDSVEDCEGESVLYFKHAKVAMISVSLQAVEPQLVEGIYDEEEQLVEAD
ncbi:putative HTH cro/C1-type domain-containing protein [Hyphomicrobium sp. 1Nfss2.1]|uniref:helix-turn-helix transcriptional regulator n=1 Tax=Hyphomicrobium sp. 1Nfss2.1 TaxID=3413936 RepID=UPI003C7EBA3D